MLHYIPTFSPGYVRTMTAVLASLTNKSMRNIMHAKVVAVVNDKDDSQPKWSTVKMTAGPATVKNMSRRDMKHAKVK